MHHSNTLVLCWICWVLRLLSTPPNIAFLSPLSFLPDLSSVSVSCYELETFGGKNKYENPNLYCYLSEEKTHMVPALKLLNCAGRTVIITQINNNNVHLSFVHQRPEPSHDTYEPKYILHTVYLRIIKNIKNKKSRRMVIFRDYSY